MPGPINGLWDAARKERAADLWKQGQSAAQIAKAFGGGLTRNAVIGVITRMGLQRGEAARPPRVKQPRAAAERSPSFSRLRDPKGIKPPVAIVAFEPLAAMSLARQISLTRGLLELTERCCRFPIGEATGADQRFCGHRRPEGQAYCDDHRRIASGGRTDLRNLMRA